MLQTSRLSFHYGSRAVLSDVSLTIQPGEIVSLLGTNGAGKSTLLKCLIRLLRPKSGTIALEGKALNAYARGDLARILSYVPQQIGAAMSLPVIDMVGLGRAPHRGLLAATDERRLIMDIVEQLDLAPFAFRPFGELSGGERQRVIIGRALAQESRWMVLDEPTANLDLRHQLETMEILRKCAKDRSVGMVIAIHDLALAARFSDRLVLLDHGEVHADGASAEVLTPENLRVVFGVNSIVGHDQGFPYVVPTTRVGSRS